MVGMGMGMGKETGGERKGDGRISLDFGFYTCESFTRIDMLSMVIRRGGFASARV